MLSIIIVNYNGLKFLLDCIASIEKYADVPYEIIVVDNASCDGSIELLKERYPQVRLIESGCNSGFAVGNNMGGRAAIGDLFLLLNNDTKLLTSLKPAVKRFEEDKRIGALGCRMYFNDRSFQDSMGFEHTPLRVVLTWTGLHRLTTSLLFREIDFDRARYEKVQDNVDWVSGAFLMTRKDLWEQLGGLDEKYFMYVEDADYCKRVRDAGCRVVYTPEVEIIHLRGGGKVWGGEAALLHQMESYIIYTRKFYGVASTFSLRLILSFIMEMRALAYCILSLCKGSTLLMEKRGAFLKAGLRLLTGGRDSSR